MILVFWLLVAHALCDYPLQGDFLARAKNHNAPIPGVPWTQALVAHALIQGGGVAAVLSLVSPNAVTYGLVETGVHTLIDWLKSETWTNYHVDQALHVVCKLAYVWVLTS